MFGIYQNGFLFIKIFQDGILWFSHFTLQFYMTVSTRKKKLRKKTRLNFYSWNRKQKRITWIDWKNMQISILYVLYGSIFSAVCMYAVVLALMMTLLYQNTRARAAKMMNERIKKLRSLSLWQEFPLDPMLEEQLVSDWIRLTHPLVRCSCRRQSRIQTPWTNRQSWLSSPFHLDLHL